MQKKELELVENFAGGVVIALHALPTGNFNKQLCKNVFLMLRRAPSKAWLTKEMQAEMAKIENCINCGKCKRKCPYELDTPELLRKNLEDYKNVLRQSTSISNAYNSS